MPRMIFTLAALLLLTPISAFSAQGSIEGTVVGVTCATHGKQCPADKLDPHVALEKDFVVAMMDGEHYLVPNIDRAVLARRVLDKVRVTGEVNKRYLAVTASKLEVRKGGAWEVVWTQEMQDEAMKWLSHPGM